QTDWSGGAVPGLVTATVTTYDSATGVDSTTVGQFSLQETAGWSVTYANWTRRSLVTVSNSDTGQTDYQVRLQVSYDADMQADFSDLRFTNVSGTSISYWLQSYTASTSAVVWVKVPSLPTGDTDIYMYYGNASATSASSGEDTFILFDDFEDGTIDPAKWVETDQVGGNEIYESGGRLNFVRAANDTWDKAVYAVGTYARANLSFESEYTWVSNFTGGYDAIMYGWHDSGAGKSYTDLIYAYYNPGTGSASSIAHAVYEDGSGRSVPAGNYWNEGTQYEIRVRAKELGGAYYDYSTDGGSNWTNTYNSSHSTESNFRPGWAFYSGTHAYDNARIRKWMDTEPASAFAAEQSKYPASAVLTSNVFNSG
ncbi:DUF2341 domain-containing protein, partial [Candidatus Dojkabacteria bacterium]|nr:DUF2341 domain-containing protein [Candidatus Dojkabacteria bacterium]